jgi:2-keto-4-pentenoate hydratase/2-oxohepta-3-ene-1,7-dioic acid hydratase in catechol pathway
MRLYSFQVGSYRSCGAEWQGQLIDLPVAHTALLEAQSRPVGPGTVLPRDLVQLLRGGSSAMDAARGSLAFMARRPAVPVGERVSYLFDEVQLRAPLQRPGKILCAGINFRHRLREESNSGQSAELSFFVKVPSSLIGPGEGILRPQFIRQLDYGIELAAVVGAQLHFADESEVMDGVAGYTILNDVTARDIPNHQLTLGKNYDTFCPLGPGLVTADEIPEVSSLRVRTWINDELRQDASTDDWILPLPRLLAALSRVMTLEPGDIISTGTPGRTPGRRWISGFLQPGDRIRMEIEGIGTLENTVVADARIAPVGTTPPSRQRSVSAV